MMFDSLKLINISLGLLTDLFEHLLEHVLLAVAKEDVVGSDVGL